MTLKLKVLKNGIQTHGADSSQFESLAEFEAWKQQCIDSNVWGKPERWVKDSPLEPLTEEQKLQAVEVRDVDDGMGNIEKEYKFLSEYEVVIEDITLQVEAEKTALEAKQLAKQEALAALKAANIDGVGTLAALRPFIKHIVTLLKD